MSVEGETGTDAVEQKQTTFSPSMQSDLSMDGDGSTNQNNSSSNDKFSQANSQVASCEPKAKKRRKQSNPLKIQNATSPKFDLSSYELSEQNESESNSMTSYFVDDELLKQNHVTQKSKVSDLSSQKGGSLSKVTNALYNSKIKEAAKANKVADKSKESSLSSCQSITDISSPESSEEIATNNEYKPSLQNQFPQMPPLLPMNPVEINETNKLSTVVPYSFSEFPSPIPQGNTLSITHRSFVTSSGVRVFNPEAYCELCEKEFCNKYFLKTHKANKHGICSVDNNYPNQNYRQYKNVHVSPQSTQQMINQMCETGAMFGSADSYCNICQKYFCNKYFLKKHRQNIHGIQESQEALSNTPSSIHVPVISSPLPLVRSSVLDTKPVDVSSGQSTKEEDSKINVSLENIKNSINSSIPFLNGSSPHTSTQNKSNLINSEAKDKKNEKFLCEICNIEFCDKCYLDSHKQNKHAQQKVVTTTECNENSQEASEVEKSNSPAEGDESNFKVQMCAPCMKTFSTAEAFQNHMLEVHVASMKEEDDVSRSSDTVNKKSIVGGTDKDLSRLDKSPAMQDVENSNSSNESGSFNCNFCLMKCKDRNSYLSHMETEHSVLGLSGSNSGQDAALTCDVCQEQFPDRLTLMTHKLKSHGITTPGVEEYVENGDFAYFMGMKPKSGSSSFCLLCNKELCNKYFMKTHMMKMHGIGVDKATQERLSAPSVSGVYCDICHKLLCSKYFLKVHKQNVHGITDDSAKVPAVSSSLYTNNIGVNVKKFEKYPNVGKLNQVPTNDTIVGKEDPIKGKIFTCDLCGQEFPSKLLLQVHLVEKHVKCNDSKNNNSIKSYSQLPEESKDAPKKVLPCSCCLFINLGDNLQAEIGHELKLISCIVCNLTYQQSDYHAHHLSHGTALPVAKKLNLENGVHEPGIDYSNSGNNSFDPSKNKGRPRKFKRFRCSKCDKTFRTKMKCLHHIQVMHKSKKGLLNQCDLIPPKKAALNNTVCRKNSEVKISCGTENGSGLLLSKDAKDAASLLSSGFHEAAPLPVPYVLPKNSDVIMQPFHLSEPKPEGVTKQDIFVPSLVYLPVSQKVSEPVTVAFTLTPA